MSKTVIYCVNDTPARRREIAAARAAGIDAIHIPPPPPYDDWEQWSRIFGRDKTAVRAHMAVVLRKVGRADLITWPDP